ncbi:GPR1/FUN34/YaaH family transporter [Streptomyces sp. NPDC002643]
MDNDVSAGSTTSTFGQLALGLTLLAFGLGHTRVIDGLTDTDAASLATYVGGIALFAAGLLAFRDRDGLTGTAYAALGALWFTWGVTADGSASANAGGLFMLLFALVALSLALGTSVTLARATYALLFVALLLLAIAAFGDSEGMAKAAGWFAAVGGLVAWYAATAALAHWPTVLPKRAAGRGVTATG